MIKNALGKFKQNPSAKFIVVGYSPTGGGHTGRLLNIIEMALEKKALQADSIVMFHIPCPWEGTPRSPLISALAKKLVEHNISVILAESDKSVYGYLNKDTGGSDDAAILKRMSHYPLRDTAANVDDKNKITGLNECHYFQLGTDLTHLPLISAKQLMSSIAATLGQNILTERCYLLTDMDPGLQKAAAAVGIPGKLRLDQQNHAILLNLNDTQLNLLPKYALLSKVLGGCGESISHIDLGGRNTLIGLTRITERLNIYSGMSKYIVRIKVSELLLSHALSEN